MIAKPYTRTRLRHEALWAVGRGRYKSTVAGDDMSGHIEAGKNKGIFFIDSELHTVSWLPAQSI